MGILSNFIPKEKKLTPKVFEQAIQEAKRGIIRSALSYTNNNKVKAAELLGIQRSKFYYIMKRVGLL